MGDNNDSFSVCFNMMKIRYPDYDKSIESTEFLTPDDKVNIFINFESVLNNLSCIKDIDKKLILERELDVILTSNILNLAAHYKNFFRKNNLETRVFIYYTGLSSNKFINNQINEDYRSYYMMKYMNNPKFSYLGESLVNTIIPMTKKIAEFLPNVYFIDGNNIEGSLIPYIIGKMDSSYKNLIITSDIYDTQYQLIDTYLCHYIKKSFSGSLLSCNIEQTLKHIFKDKVNEDYTIFNNKPYYLMLLSCVGDKKRSIEPIRGIGTKTVIKLINRGLDENIITDKTNTVELLKNIIAIDSQNDLVNNFNCINIEDQYNVLSKEDIFNIEKQLIDRFDNGSLLKLNATKFYNHQMMLEQLTM